MPYVTDSYSILWPIVMGALSPEPLDLEGYVRPDSHSGLWPIIIFWGGIFLVSLFCSNKRKSSSEKQEAKKEDAADPVKQRYDHQSKEKHDAGILAYAVGRIYQAEKDNNMAVKSFSEAIDCGFQDEKVFAWRGCCLHVLDRQHEAIKDFSKAIELDPSDCYNYYMRARAKILTGDCIGFEDDMHLAINLARLSTPLNDVHNLDARQKGFSSVEALYKNTLLMLRSEIDSLTSTANQCAKYRRDTGLPLTLEEYDKIKKKEEEDKKRIMASRSWLP